MKSWMLELTAGIILQAAGLGLGLPLVGRAVLSLGVSYYYETRLDRNGWSAKDFGQRAVGSALFEVILKLK